LRRSRSSRCQCCQNPERWRIELLRAGGASLDSLAAKFGLHRDAIDRHYRNHVSVELKTNYLAGPAQLAELAEKTATEGDSVLDHLRMVRTVLTAQLAAMTEAGDGRGAAYVAGRLTAVLETVARVTGQLGDMARSTTFNFTTNNVAVLTEHPAFRRVQATLLRALAPHPEARAAVVAALRILDEENTQTALAGPAMVRY
jgi:hypothetical protein